MTAALLARLAASPVLETVAPAGEHRTATGAILSLATADMAGRSIMLASTTSPLVADAIAAASLADSAGMLSITVAGAPLTGGVSGCSTRGIHALVGTATLPAATAIEASGLVLVAAGDTDGASSLLAADDVPAAVDLAALMLSYLPAPDATQARYEPVERPDLGGLGAAAQRNAVATLFDVADDALRVLPGRIDELVLALARVQGASAAVVAPQLLTGGRPGPAALGRLEMLLRLAGRADLPVVVLGGTPAPAGDRDLIGFGLRAVGRAAAELRRPVIFVADDAERSLLDDVLASASRAITIDPAAGIRAGIARWLHADPA